MDEKEKDMLHSVAEVLMSMPKEFAVENRVFHLYPVTLGKTYLLAPLYEQLGVNKDIAAIDQTLEMLRAVNEHKDIACKIIAYHTMKTREEMCSVENVLEVSDFIEKNTTLEELTKILLYAMQRPDVKKLQDYLGITREHQLIQKVNMVKDKSTTLEFCGKTIFGSLIIPACEKLNMTPTQIIWEISYDLLQMLMSDVEVSIYLSEKERRRVHIPSDRTRINADSKEGMEQIKRMNWN